MRGVHGDHHEQQRQVQQRVVEGDRRPGARAVIAPQHHGHAQERQAEYEGSHEVYDARPRGPFDFREAPLPRFDLLDPDRYPRFTVQSQRGCPYACEFCAASMRLSPTFRTKPVHKVLHEIRTLKQLYRRPFIEFADDNTFADKRHGKALMRGLAREGVRWFTETDVSVADDEELLKLMRDAGYGKIINMSSTLARTTIPTRSVYAAIKAAISHLTESLDVEWGPEGIRVNALAPAAGRG